MKLLQVNTVCAIGSTGKLVMSLYNASTKAGHTCCVAYARGPVPDSQDVQTYRIGGRKDILLHAVCARLFDCAGFCSKTATKAFIKQMERYEPDLVHLHNLHGYYLDVEQVFTYLCARSIPVVWTLHDCWPLTGHCASFMDCEQWKYGCPHCGHSNYYPKSYLSRSNENHRRKQRVFTNMEKLQIVAVSNWLKDVVAQSFLGNYPIETIENGVDLHRFYPELNTMKNQLGIQNVMVLCVANVWSPQKGLADILEMARHARSNMTFVIVGLNERQNKSLPPDVVGFGKISEEQTLRTLYSAADVCVNPSRSETFGMVPLEALACGTPVIVYDVTGCSGIVDDSCGAKVPLASGWQGLLDAAMRYANWKPDCCRQRARQFDEDRCLQAYQALYMRLKNG